MKIKQLLLLFIVFVLSQSCDYFSNPNEKMVKVLEARKMMYNVKENVFAEKKEVAYYDSINLIKVISIIDLFGWLSPNQVGREGNSTLWLVIQHSDLRTQQKYFPA